MITYTPLKQKRKIIIHQENKVDNQRAFEEFLVKNKRPDIRNLDSTQLAEKLNEEAATAYWLLFESDNERD